MKQLVLGSLTLAALVSQTTGCVFTSDDPEDFATINAEWSFKTVNASGQLSPPNSCPSGFATVALHNQEVDSVSLRPIGDAVIDLFDCVDMRNFSDPLAPGVYETFLSVTNDTGSSVYADSISAIVDVTAADKTFSAEIIDNGGYFKVAWDLRRQATNAQLTCRDVAGLSGVEIASTLAGSTAAVTDIFDCENGVDFSAPVMAGNYVVRVEALNASNQAIGPGKLLNNQVVQDRNRVTDLGLVMLLIP